MLETVTESPVELVVGNTEMALTSGSPQFSRGNRGQVERRYSTAISLGAIETLGERNVSMYCYH